MDRYRLVAQGGRLGAGFGRASLAGLAVVWMAACPRPPGPIGPHGALQFDGVTHEVYAVGSRLRVELRGQVDSVVAAESSAQSVWDLSWVVSGRVLELEAVSVGVAVVRFFDVDGEVVDALELESAQATDLVLSSPPRVSIAGRTDTQGSAFALVLGGRAWFQLVAVDDRSRVLGGSFEVDAHGYDQGVRLLTMGPRGRLIPLGDAPLRTHDSFVVEGVALEHAEVRHQVVELDLELALSTEIVEVDTVADLESLVTVWSQDDAGRPSLGKLWGHAQDDGGRSVLGIRCTIINEDPDLVEVIDLPTIADGEPMDHCAVAFQAIGEGITTFNISLDSSDVETTVLMAVAPSP